jgi:diketogulonate reductase-like aldo/keto reductase
LEAGYRHIDGAWIYNNEAAVGSALQAMAHHVPRESLFITSKLWNTFHNPEDIEPTLDETLRMLQTEYLDLYLIHWPIAQTPTGGGTNVVDWDLTEQPIKTWLKLEELVRAGKIRNIGVSKSVSFYLIFPIILLTMYALRSVSMFAGFKTSHHPRLSLSNPQSTKSS